MIKITDGKKTAEITMRTWEDNSYSPDWSADFFEAGSLEYDEESDTFRVQDVDYCIDQAKDWEAEAENNVVDVYITTNEQ